MKIGLKAARVNKDLTQGEAAKKIGVSKDTISNWERGKSYPDAICIKEIENVYGVNYNDLIFLPKNNALSVSGAFVSRVRKKSST
ncbi:DNA-binding XRE family transcriptional regulator [Anaerospora hongkongensis]|uniref:DNA-binding XRE family transcriptional regulator n=1 Tax=Anaerospora hongkongensis TaxID=244830 RepID=A0A4R1PX28_9FIRM|nr:helix-turn-helix transcriptional regulator [Anaerospora hongkongensis]TCL35618.1 DNA-binding XRE family transcriptional regulator [Anaerospora hongkongensis]